MIFASLGPGVSLAIVVAVTMAASFFVMAAEGATFGIVPLIKNRVTGQIAGNVGAYGNVGAVCYLTIYSLLPQGAASDRAFFQILGVVALMVACLNAFFLKEPTGSHEDEQEEVHSSPVTALPEQQYKP